METTDYDLFNGDADGICALHQLRLARPRAAMLITGVKREIGLLARLPRGAGARITVLDVSLEKNRADLLRLLDDGATIDYFDHHHAGAIPDHPRLNARIDTDAARCTSLIVDEELGGAHRLWAAVGAVGDNLIEPARRCLGDLPEEECARLQQLGTLLNYNGYGVTLDDLHFHPAELYRAIHPFADPRAFIAEHPAYATLEAGYRDDMARIEAVEMEQVGPRACLLRLPDAGWSRRASGVYGNLLARRHPERAHALATRLPQGGWRISVRAPLSDRQGAERLCMAFPTGGGRAAAAGINALPDGELERFIAAFRDHWR
ncbi:MAG: hypothetical protein D6682_04660 [Zetaproteobacteria bacterium]|nr:MAG: hypothetical protein D6682_04660 [Zetaproteobacteria bacterium]